MFPESGDQEVPNVYFNVWAMVGFGGVLISGGFGSFGRTGTGRLGRINCCARRATEGLAEALVDFSPAGANADGAS
jgi:hypothetical protein